MAPDRYGRPALFPPSEMSVHWPTMLRAWPITSTVAVILLSAFAQSAGFKKLTNTDTLLAPGTHGICGVSPIRDRPACALDARSAHCLSTGSRSRPYVPSYNAVVCDFHMMDPLFMWAPATSYPPTLTPPGPAGAISSSLMSSELLQVTAVCGARSCVPPHIKGPPCDITALETLCSQTPHCAGFNSDGWLKPCVATSCGAQVQPHAQVDTFVASSVVPGPFPPSPPVPPPAPPVPEPPIPPVPQHEDWHYPEEEASELAAEWARELHVVSLTVHSNGSGTFAARLASSGANGPTASASVPGDTVFGWTLRGFISGLGDGTPPMGVLERTWDRWGFIVMLSATGRLVSPANSSGGGSVAGGSGFRKGVGSVATTRRPRYNLTAVDPGFFSAAANDPLDFLKRGMLARSPFNETTFVAAAAQLPPTREYGIVGNAGSHTKFSVAYGNFD